MSQPIANGVFHKMGKIGEGTYGVVYKAKNVATQEIVALKNIKFEDENDGIPSTALREISLLKQLSHPNIVHLKDVALQTGNLTLIFDYLEYDLKKYIEKDNSPIPINVVKSFLYQILLGVSYCHSNRVIHRDLKTQNILLSNNGIIKIADFGLARAYGLTSDALTHEVVTLWYRAPEIILGQTDYSLPVDVWSIGCIFSEMVTKVPLFAGDSEIDQLFKIFQMLGTPTAQNWASALHLPNFLPKFPMWKQKPLATKVKGLDSKGLDLLAKMLELNPNRRISARSALRHV